jgi:hypothetical protein
MNATRQLTHCWSSFAPPKMLKKKKCMIYPLTHSSGQKRNGCLQQSSRKSSCNFEIGVGTELKDSEERKTANKNNKSKLGKKNSKKNLQTSHTNRKPSSVFIIIIIIIESGATNLSNFSHGACLIPDVPRTKIS